MEYTCVAIIVGKYIAELHSTLCQFWSSKRGQLPIMNRSKIWNWKLGYLHDFSTPVTIYSRYHILVLIGCCYVCTPLIGCRYSCTPLIGCPYSRTLLIDCRYSCTLFIGCPCSCTPLIGCRYSCTPLMGCFVKGR